MAGTSKASQYDCPKCGITFNRGDSLKRHNKEKHYDSKANLDYVEDMDSLGNVKCDQRNKTYKRKYEMKQHSLSVHGDSTSVKSYSCIQCGKSFPRKDNMLRHAKLYN